MPKQAVRPSAKHVERFDVRAHFRQNAAALDQFLDAAASDEPPPPDSLLTVPLFGGIARMGEYYTQAIVYGKKVRLQVDTGSSSLIVVGEGCQNCTSRSRVNWNRLDAVPCDGKVCAQCFVATDSCGFRLKYGDNTPMYSLEASGVVVQTRVKISENAPLSEPVYTYVIQRETGNWPRKVDGILGLGFERLNCNPTCFPPAWKRLAPANAGGFSMCFGDIDGTMWFYPANIKRTGKRIKAPVIGDPRMYYAIHSKGLAIASETDPRHFDLFHYAPIQDPKVRSFAIVDSGTTLLIVPTPTWTSMVKLFQSKYCHLPGLCESPSIFERPNDFEAICLTESPYEIFPTLGIVVGDAVLRLPPSLYFIQYKKSVYCLGIQPGPVTIIGDSVLRGFTVSYEANNVIFAPRLVDNQCGSVAGLNFSSTDLLLTNGAKIGYIHNEIGATPAIKRFLSLAILVFVIYAMLQGWRRYMRRRLGYVEI